MKKLLFTVLFIVVLLVGGCTSNPTAEVVEPTAEVVEPTAEVVEPTAEVVEPTAEVVEPTAEVVEPTAEVVEPTTCPSEAEAVEIADPENLFIDLGDPHGIVKATEAVYPSGEKSYIIALFEPETLMKDGGTFSFVMPSLGFIYLNENTDMTIEGQRWERYGSLARSPEGNFLVSQGSTVNIETPGGLEFPNSILDILFLSGKAIPAEDVLQVQEEIFHSTTCSSQGLWEITLNNNTPEDIEVPVNGYRYLMLHPDGVKTVKFSWGETEPKNGFILSKGDSLTLLPNGSVTLILLDLYPAE